MKKTTQQKVSNVSKEIADDAHKIEQDYIKENLKFLDNARLEVIAAIAGTPWAISNLSGIKRNLDLIINDYRAKAINLSDLSSNTFWNLGIEMADKPLRSIGIYDPFLSIDDTLQTVLRDYSADLITNISEDTLKKINTEISLGLLGDKTSHEAMKAIGKNLTDKSVFSSIAARQEAIATTEMNRALSMAHQLRQEQIKKSIPGLKKRWRHSSYVRNPRTGHEEAHGQVVGIDEYFYVAPNIGGFKEPILYPRAPGVSAANTISCHCMSETYHPDWEKETIKG